MDESAYLANWRSVLARRAAQAAETFGGVAGVKALLLGGSLGGGEPWPLSDIDIVPIYDDGRELEANGRIQELRTALIEAWEREGWRTALDVGTLYLSAATAKELARADAGAAERLLGDRSVYHIVDKAYNGQAVYDPDGIGRDVAHWIRRNRFDAEIAGMRKAKLKERYAENGSLLDEAIALGRRSAAAYFMNEAVELLRTYLLESWGERDNSFARLGSRFERLAERKGVRHIADRFNAWKSLDDASAARRIACAPESVRNRHRLSYACRRMVGEDVSDIQDARDVLRVFGRYELRRAMNGDPEGADAPWLAIPREMSALRQTQAELLQASRDIFAGNIGGGGH
ncbi:hypothetical protein [Paenibacillus sp. GYB003]|uniref:hypothetical protein n=1 Tax=Paenibacillus sp. GYB003 TaxID=2994392 RepID=UPI002F964B62